MGSRFIQDIGVMSELGCNRRRCGQEKAKLSTFSAGKATAPEGLSVRMTCSPKAINYIASEILIWGALFYNKSMEASSYDDYMSHASLHSGVNPKGFGASYLNALGSFQSSFEYNQYQQQISYDPVLYSGDKMWNWDENENRLRFKNLRERELDYKNYVKYC